MKHFAEYETALKCFERAIRFEPSNPEFFLHQGRTHFETKTFEEALNAFERTISLAGSNQDQKTEAEGRYWKGQVFEARGDTAKAASSYRRAVVMDSTHHEANSHLSTIETQTKLRGWYAAAGSAFDREDWEEAEKMYERIRAIEPKYRDVSEKLAIVKNKIKAQELYDTALALQRQGKLREAISSLQEAKTYDQERTSKFDQLIEEIKQELDQPAPDDSLETGASPKKDSTENGSRQKGESDSSGVEQSGEPQETKFEKLWQTYSKHWPEAVIVIVVIIITISVVRKSRKEQIRFQQYRIEKEIGRGGMGCVYKAYDEEKKRIVAVKEIMLENIKDQKRIRQFIRRFRHEAEILHLLKHPNIVELYNYGEKDGKFYIVMEYVGGPTVEELLNNKMRLATAEAIRIIKQSCHALEYAHVKGIIHRDIKPSNVMLNEDKRVKLVDFGLAKIALETTKQTLTGDRPGTPIYFSPEQIDNKDIDYRTDIFSLGLVFFEMLTGKHPFKKGNDVSVYQIHNAVVNEPAPKLIEILLKKPQEIERIIEKMLAKEPERRYQNAGEIIHDLNNLA